MQTIYVLLIEFKGEFELIYYQCRTERLHFIHQSIHALIHYAREILCLGPPICCSQWTMERAIGYYVLQIRQPSNPYANLAQRMARHSQLNAMRAKFPEIHSHTSANNYQIPQFRQDLGEGYTLLRPAEPSSTLAQPCESDAIQTYITTTQPVAWQGFNFHDGWEAPVHCWGRVQLPNGQVACTLQKEVDRPNATHSRNIKVSQAFL